MVFYRRKFSMMIALQGLDYHHMVNEKQLAGTKKCIYSQYILMQAVVNKDVAMKTNALKGTLKATTRTFKSGNSIAVRIPHEFNLEAGKTFEIKRRGRELVLVERAENLGAIVEILQSMPSDFFAEGRVDLPPQARDFSAMFDEPVIKTKKKQASKTPSKAMAKKK